MTERHVDLTEVGGLCVGHAENPEGSSGVTAVLFDAATPTVVEVRGGASATYDIASLSLDATFGRRWALFFSGGSLFGLDAARGVRLRVLELGRGHRVFRNPNMVAPVSGAALFDLPRASTTIPDYLPLGYEAARRAVRDDIPVGRVGAGAGATVGKYLGRQRAMHGGVGTAAARLGRRGSVGVLVVVNSFGAIRDPSTGRFVAGARDEQGRVVAPEPAMAHTRTPASTVLGLVVTDLAIERPALARVVAMSHAGLGSVVTPFHSATDGDVLFGASTGNAGPAPREGRPGETADYLGSLAAQLLARATLGAVRIANAER
ncbi:MAG TPA: P1 family peptidase [Thermoplasmata archaeon]|nr:P1 family peptidase [Thermoplasmata archaeon]